ncbi:MAG: hypothetical protein ABI600_00570 [Luteolibacter sp.]
MKFFSILLVAVSVFAVSCERHEFEGPDGTKQLHEHHAAHAAEHGEHAEKAEEPAH